MSNPNTAKPETKKSHSRLGDIVALLGVLAVLAIGFEAANDNK